MSKLMLDLQGLHLTPAEEQLLTRPLVGGVILFSRNIQDAAQVAALSAEIRSIRPDLLLAVDQEGGRVQRLKQGFTLLPAMRELGRLYELNQEAALTTARLLGQLMAAEVIEVGLDISFAPVLDIDYQTSEVIGDRAFASDIPSLIDLAQAFIQGMQQSGMAATAKHFPGHGYVTGDSHNCIPLDSRSLEDIQTSCLKPFVALAAQVQGIMPAHIIYTQVDTQPAGFSKVWLTKLRKELNFTGMIFSDDLAMEGASQAGSFPQRAAAALKAGCDQVLVCNNPKAALEVLDWLETQDFEPCNKIAALKAQPASSNNWLESPEALLARQLAEHLVAKDLQSVLHLLT
ncbi:beta-N-acetylhexosaminidase [Marinospirillum insulare]|uniref:Beta-hexosaminidase n=1 Tax=Marinospirillum insulare TaxID=217169 RepID=A0ABQ6A027_9GAMM|nr:beta-N-acetylhexosaminidase [Marinospirillum insulare]GLR64708.1 beta-hexosaminidase [Marinospirillum insulare]